MECIIFVQKIREKESKQNAETENSITKMLQESLESFLVRANPGQTHGCIHGSGGTLDG